MNTKLAMALALATVVALTAGSVAALAFSPPRADFSIGKKFQSVGRSATAFTPGIRFSDTLRQSQSQVFGLSATQGPFTASSIQDRARARYGRPGAQVVNRLKEAAVKQENTFSGATQRLNGQRVIRFNMSSLRAPTDWNNRSY